jgi:phosphoribosylanthranilate isomerase
MADTKTKICGVNSPAAFDAVVAAGADYLGFVFFPPSPRFVAPLEAARLSGRHSGGPARVGLFVHGVDADITAALAAIRLDVLQVYADAARCREIKTNFGIPVWRAIGVAAATDLPATDEGLDGFVIEAKPPAGATRPGGNAAALDVSLLAGWHAPGFWLLGGGLTPDNVAAAITATGAPGVDVSSGVEIAPGVKSPGLIAKFVTTARSAARPVE